MTRSASLFARPGVALPALLLGAAAALTPASSAACGGTFCDTGPQSMPVDQTGENVLFVMDGPYVEAHVQIQYTPGATRFAWIVPMPAVPDVSVGSALLFAELLRGTVPTFGNQVSFDVCGNNCPRGGEFGSGAGGALGTGGASSSADGGGGPTVVLRETVGAFEVVALQGGTAQEVSDWLTINGYASTATAPALLATYVAKNFVFVAVKLTGSADLNEIHPLVFRYLGTEPCIPLELTAVAASEDMGVRAFFLGEDRVFPSNYKHVVVNPVRIDWQNNAANYNAAVTRAVDSAVADGKAFVTEYAGPTAAVVSASPVYSSSWNAAPFAGAAPRQVIELLNQQGLVSCYSSFQCQMNHPLVLGLLKEFLPPTPQDDDATYYSEVLPSTTNADAFPSWNAARFAALLDERIIVPGRHAASLLTDQPYLTRLFTTISPAEMTLDPEFVARPEYNAPGVTLGGISSQRIACDGASGLALPGSTRQVGLEANRLWPVFSSLMPYAERIEEYGATGAPIVLVDNTDRIDQQLDQWNSIVGWPAPPPPPPDPSQCGSSSGSGGVSAGGSPSGAGGASSGVGGAGPSGGRAGTPTDANGGANSAASGSGGSSSAGAARASGGCSTSGGGAGTPMLFGLALLGFAGRMRRARRVPTPRRPAIMRPRDGSP